MSNWQLKTPVVFIIFNRPDTTAKVFEAIRQVKPPQLFVIADGARDDKPGEAEKCAAARAIIEQVDWKCEVIKNYSDINMGCQCRVSSGLNWVFSNTEEAIILEDDCLPHPTFFQYCEELLEYYRHDRRIMSIAGVNFQAGQQRTEYSYYVSLYHDCWGWATWKRAWQYFDFDMKLWSMIKDSGILTDKLLSFQAAKYWHRTFCLTYNGQINSWFFRWLFSCWVQSGLGIFPNVNLISNIGFGQAATHTTSYSSYSNMKIGEMQFPLKHPPYVLQNLDADKFTQKTRFNAPIWSRAVAKLQKLIYKV
ncbi:glycosyltransferase family 2 protein [Chroococcidiopsis sp. FACHB-1243]|uniref:glycosyltransferase family A protein n=1 Tax=Chroococcidiopsis sp. [FACHB-1243] TaxID=2692781 RepID=UPI00177F20C1|nr:glycosyltransferase family A protein [Chroococcidiopsis sp. [FACHB-1243]]MBD2305817.1 glycosyltransferase family 2 protein [Chroococcidiopsis sp. [FACHB-1243]]